MQLPGAADTIVALATAPGRGAIALVRVSGPDALKVVSACVRDGISGIAPRCATLRTLCHPLSGDVVDRALITWFPAPHSYTGDEVVEISTHGGYVVPAAVIAALLAAGAREALPGEFTRRALMAGKMDLLQAEAVADLVDARSSAVHRVALEQLDGGLSRRLLALRSECLQLEALLAYDIDFPEEDDGPIDPARIRTAVDAVIGALDLLLATAPAVPMLREGAIVVLAGVPNAGKSSLFNALIGEARAIVTEVPGTTRDALDVMLDTPVVPLRLVDTAGLRESDDRVEQLGIEVSEKWLRRAHVVLACGATRGDAEATERAVREAGAGAAAVLRVLTKQDLVLQVRDERSDLPTGTWYSTSAELGTGLSELLDAVQARVVREYGVVAPDVPRLTRERHHVAVRTAREELAAFAEAWDEGRGVPAIIAAVHVRTAVHALDELIGAVSLDDVLDRLFREFCVGK